MKIDKILEDIKIINEVTNDLNDITDKSIFFCILFCMTTGSLNYFFGLSDLFISFAIIPMLSFFLFAIGMCSFLPDIQKKYFKVFENHSLYLNKRQKLYNAKKLKKITNKLESLSEEGKSFLIAEDHSEKIKIYTKESLFIKMMNHCYVKKANSKNALIILFDLNNIISKELKENEKSNLLFSLITKAVDTVGRDSFFQSKNELISIIEKDLLMENEQLLLLNMIDDKIKEYESNSYIEIQNKFKKLKEKKDIDILSEAKNLVIKSI